MASWMSTFADLLPAYFWSPHWRPTSIEGGHLRYIYHQACLFINPTDLFVFRLFARITNVELSVSTCLPSRSLSLPSRSLSLSLRISVKTRVDHNICCFPLETHTVLQNDQKVPPHISLPAPLTSLLFFLKINFQTS